MIKTFSKIALSLFIFAHIGVSSANTPPQANVVPGSPQTVSSENRKININTATAEQLSSGVLKGIGLAKAKTIIAYREEHGKFNSLEELAQVKGIGAKLLEKNKTLLTLN